MTQRSHSASKKLGKKKGALPKGQGKTGNTEFTHESPATSATNSPRKVDDTCPTNFSVPNHSYGVHVKRKQFIVEVQLHHIPEKLIDVEVVKDRVTVSTLRYTKKYKLDVVIPTDVEPDIHTASSILDHSTLRVIVPLTNLADHYSERVNAIRQDREKARMLRFDQTQEGNLKMRVKKIQTKSPPTSGHRGATVESSSKQNKKRSREETDALSGIKKKKEQRTTASLEESYATEKDVALRLMKDVAEQTQLKLAEKQERLEKLQKLRSERILTRRECIKERDEKKTVAYQKMLMEKKSHLQRMIEQQGLVEPVVVQHVAPAKSHSAPHNNENKKGKRVSWAMA